MRLTATASVFRAGRQKGLKSAVGLPDKFVQVSPADYHILVLEDEPAVLHMVTASLNNSGFSHVSTSGSIAGARQCWHAQTGNFDLVITDFVLPDGSASSLIRELLRSKPDLRVVLMTGLKDNFVRIKKELSDDWPVLGKPFRPSELLDRVSAELGRTGNS